MDLVATHAARFFEDFARDAKVADRTVTGSAELADLFGVRLAPSLARWVDFLATHERKERYGPFGWFGGRGGWTIDWLPGTARPRADGATTETARENALVHALAQPFRYPALLAGGIAIGCDLDGAEWVVPIEDHTTGESELGSGAGDDVPVFAIDHDEGDLRLAADSLATFAAILVVLERGFMDGDGPTAEEKAAFAGRIDPRRFGLHRAGIDAIAPAAGDRSPIAARFAATAHLRACLAENPNMDAPPRIAGAPTDGNHHASESVADLLALWIRGEDDLLDAALDRHAGQGPRFLRDAVTHISEVRRRPRVDPATVDPAGRDNDAYLRVCTLLRG